MSNTENTPPARGEDERRADVDPSSNPAPHSPAADEEAVRKAEENLDRVTTK